MLLVTGANGKLARTTIEELRRRVPASEIAVTTRDPNSGYARELAAAGMSVRSADFDDPETLATAFEGAKKALIIPSAAEDEHRLEQNRNAIQAARAAGVGHLIYTSFMNASPTAIMSHSRIVHYPTEVLAKESGADYTILRNAIFAEAVLWSFDPATNIVQRPAPDLPLTYICQEDCGYAAAEALTGKGHEGKTYTLTMEQSCTAAEAVGWMAKASGLPIQLKLLAEHELPPFLAEVVAITKAGEFTLVTSDFKAMTGRAPKTMERFFADHWSA